MPKTIRRRFTLVEKALLVGEIESRFRAGEGSIRAISMALGVCDTSYYAWVKAGVRSPSPSQSLASRHHTAAERAQLVAEVDARITGGMNTRPACRAVGISEKSFRRWRERLASPLTMRPVEVTALVPIAPAGVPSITFAPVVSTALPASLTLHVPGGYRVVGLDVAATSAAEGPRMLTSTRQIRIWACAEPVSMRKSFDGLLAAARQSLNRDPLAGDMFLFVARDRKQARVLHWDGTGLVVIAKRLEKGRFNAPWEGHRDKPWCLSSSELALFLEGSRLVGHYEVSPPTIILGGR